MDFRATVASFIANPVDPNNDGKTSVMEWAAFLGLMFVLAFGWKLVLNAIFSNGAD